jgi:predicted nucleotidyltransferase
MCVNTTLPARRLDHYWYTEYNRTMNIILEGITGSRAYGLETEDSDVDIKGVFVAPTRNILSLNPPAETIDQTKPDISYHEVSKFIRLALKGNPTILELLFLDGYRVLTKQGKLLVDNRHKFLSNVIYHSYGGYAISQARKLNARGDSFSSTTKNRYAKHARHCFRLLQQGRQLLETGDLQVRVTNRDELFEVGELPVAELVDRFEEEFKAFDQIRSVLPEKPDVEAVNEILLKIRKVEW